MAKCQCSKLLFLGKKSDDNKQLNSCGSIIPCTVQYSQIVYAFKNCDNVPCVMYKTLQWLSAKSNSHQILIDKLDIFLLKWFDLPLRHSRFH